MNRKILIAAMYFLAQNCFGVNNDATISSDDGRATITTAGGNLVTEDPYTAVVITKAVATNNIAEIIRDPSDVKTLVINAEEQYKAGNNFSNLVLVRFNDAYTQGAQVSLNPYSPAASLSLRETLPNYVHVITMAGNSLTAYVTQEQATELGKYYCEGYDSLWATDLILR